jgi:hypothetical protein
MHPVPHELVVAAGVVVLEDSTWAAQLEKMPSMVSP